MMYANSTECALHPGPSGVCCSGVKFECPDPVGKGGSRYRSVVATERRHEPQRRLNNELSVAGGRLQETGLRQVGVFIPPHSVEDGANSFRASEDGTAPVQLLDLAIRDDRGWGRRSARRGERCLGLLHRFAVSARSIPSPDRDITSTDRRSTPCPTLANDRAGNVV